MNRSTRKPKNIYAQLMLITQPLVIIAVSSKRFVTKVTRTTCMTQLPYLYKPSPKIDFFNFLFLIYFKVNILLFVYVSMTMHTRDFQKHIFTGVIYKNHVHLKFPSFPSFSEYTIIKIEIQVRQKRIYSISSNAKKNYLILLNSLDTQLVKSYKIFFLQQPFILQCN